MGLEKLQASAAAVANMQNELTALQPQLVQTVGEVEQLMARIGKEKAEVVEPKAEVFFFFLRGALPEAINSALICHIRLHSNSFSALIVEVLQYHVVMGITATT